MKEGTTADNFMANCGGWNCAHKLIPVPASIVPKEIRDKFVHLPKKEDKMTNQQRIAHNKNEYERLKSDQNYKNVKFNDRTGGLAAMHIEHNFDPTIGKFGIPRGDYERIAVEVLYEYGQSVVLGSENMPEGIKISEGWLNGQKFDIKGIEGTGKRNIEYKIYEASRQGAKCIVLYYHDANLFSLQHIFEGYNAYLRNSKSKRIQAVYYIVDNKLHKIEV